MTEKWHPENWRRYRYTGTRDTRVTANQLKQLNSESAKYYQDPLVLAMQEKFNWYVNQQTSPDSIFALESERNNNRVVTRITDKETESEVVALRHVNNNPFDKEFRQVKTTFFGYLKERSSTGYINYSIKQVSVSHILFPDTSELVEINIGETNVSFTPGEEQALPLNEQDLIRKSLAAVNISPKPPGVE